MLSFKLLLKVLLPTTFIIGGVSSAIVAPTVVSLNDTQKARNIQNIYYLFDGQYFNSLEEANNYFIVKNKSINSDLYLGNVKSSIFDLETGRLNINELRNPNNAKLFPAFKNALNEYVPSYEEAKRSFVNPGLIQYKYDDLNGRLFNSYEEAKESMIKNKNPTSVLYQKVNINNKEYILNPFNQNDINEFKWLAMKDLFASNSNYFDFKLSVYTKQFSNKENNQYIYSNIFENFFGKEYSYFEIVDYLLNKYFQMKYDFLQSLDYDADLLFVRLGKAEGYVIWNFSFDKNLLPSSNKNINAWMVNNGLIRFTNLKFEDLLMFNKFLSRPQFKTIANMWVKKWALNDIADEAYIGNFLGTHFNIYYHGDDKGAANGVDIKILEKGAESTCHSELDFDVSIKLTDTLENKQKINNWKSFFTYDNFINKYTNNELDSIINTEYGNLLIRYLWEKVSSLLLSTKNINDRIVFHKSNNIVSYLDIQDDSSTIPWIDNQFIVSGITNNYFSKSIDNVNGSEINNFNLNCNPTFNLLDRIDINSFINSNLNYIDFFIKYNNNPIFLLNDEFKKRIVNGISNDKFFYIGKNILSNTTPIYLIKNSNLKDLINNKDNSNMNLINSNLINVSQSYIRDNSSITIKIKEENNKKYFENNKFYYEHNQIKYYDPLKNEEAISPSLTNNKNVVYTEENAVGAFNKDINNIINKYSKIPDYTRERLPDLNNVLYLTNETNYPLAYYYGEVLSRPDDINVSLFANNTINIFYDQSEIELAIKNSMVTNPAKVVILYDLMGNIINPGVKLTKDEELKTTNDAIYDSESTVLDNILRTKIIKNDPTKVFYQEQDKTFTLLENKSQLIYNLSLDNKIYYFASYHDAWRYCLDYVKLNSIKVVK